MWSKGFKTPKSVFMDIEYSEEFDKFLYKQVGYDKLSSLMMGLFISPYAATSLSEYFATGFAEFYTNSDHKYLQKIGPSLYKKLILLQSEEKLDNQY
jgi:Mlc titration factor MtfA (ptsG expression regulator)